MAGLAEDVPIVLCLYVRTKAKAVEVVSDFLAADYPDVRVECHPTGGYVVFRPQSTVK